MGVMAKIPDMSKSDPVTVGMNDVGHIIFRVGAKGTGTQAQTVVWIIYHMKKSSDGCFIAEQSWDSEDIPRRIILMNGHLDAGLMAGWHDCFQKILQIFPQFFLWSPGDTLQKVHPVLPSAPGSHPGNVFP